MATRARAIETLSSFHSSPSYLSWEVKATASTFPLKLLPLLVFLVAAETVESTPVDEPAPAKPKSATKTPAKSLPQLMDEEVIPSLKATLEAQNDILELELSFQDNRLEGSFLKRGNPYSFCAFFPSGVLTSPKGFSLSSYGLEVSTVEPFLIDNKKIMAKHVVF